MTIINSFSEKFQFLSNFYYTNQIIDGIVYTTNENYFQAMKTTNKVLQINISKVSPAQAKKIGRKLKLRQDWDQIKNNIMSVGLIAKFQQNNNITNKLLETKEIELIEGNYWHDNY